METRIDHIAGGIYRIATMTDAYGITFNQFLIDDERPTLIHTGEHGSYENVRKAISEVVDPSKLAYVALLHWEGDENGSMEPLLAVRDLRKTFPRGGGLFAQDSQGARFTAVAGVSFDVSRGETFAIVGESGCGKTTLARMLLRLIEPDGGAIQFQNRDLLALRGRELRSERRRMQMVFQDPFASLNPRMRVGEIVAEPLAIHERALSTGQRLARATAILERVGLNRDALGRYPHEFSGGQRQRIGIARALILQPGLIVADEPVSALDVSVGAQVLLLLQEDRKSVV